MLDIRKETKQKMGFFEKLKNGLGKTKNSINEKINNVFSVFRKVDEEMLEELEEVLVMSDIGMETSVKVIDKLRERIKKEKIEDEENVKIALKEIMQEILDVSENTLDLSRTPAVILFVGVNGAGKTTSIGKIANNLRQNGKKVVVAAADTFRAAAVEQLEIWAKRAGADKVLSIVFTDKTPKKCCDNIFEVINKSFSILCKELAEYEWDGADYLLKIKEPKVGLLEKKKMNELYQEGYIQTKQKIGDIKRKLRI